MKKQAMFMVVVSLIIVILYCGCLDNKGTIVDDEKSKFIGTWKTEQNITLTFFEDEKCRMEGFFNSPGTWNIKDDTVFITLTFEGGKNYMSYNYSFSGDGKILALEDPSKRVWTYYKQS